MTIQSATMLASITATQVGFSDFGGPAFTPEIVHRVNLTNGTGAGQANILWTDQRTVATASNDDLDLSGILIDAIGQTVSAVEIVGIMIVNAPREGAANTTSLTIGAGTNPVTGYLGGTTPTIGPVRPGGFVMFGTGDAGGFGVVTPATGDILRIANSAGASATYQIAILARNA